jgi:rhamnosyltransferase
VNYDTGSNAFQGSGKVALIVPWFRGERHVAAFLDGLEGQTRFTDVYPVFLDSSDTPQTAVALRERGYDVITVSQKDFDHGGTRNVGLRHARGNGCVLAIFMTQDATLDRRDSIEAMTKVMSEDNMLAALSGAQIPRPDAAPLEAFLRRHRYPSVQHADPARTATISNTFCCYRLDALEEVGDFPEPMIFGEDAAAAAMLTKAGYRTGSTADATVLHSHAVSPRAFFNRYFDMGATIWTLPESVTADFSQRGGISALREEFAGIKTQKSISLTIAWLGYLAPRLAGYSAGRVAKFIPHRLASRLSSSPALYRRCTAGH